MTPEERKEIAAHSKAIAKMLYKNTATDNAAAEVKYLTGIEISKVPNKD